MGIKQHCSWQVHIDCLINDDDYFIRLIKSAFRFGLLGLCDVNIHRFNVSFIHVVCSRSPNDPNNRNEQPTLRFTTHWILFALHFQCADRAVQYSRQSEQFDSFGSNNWWHQCKKKTQKQSVFQSISQQKVCGRHGLSDRPQRALKSHNKSDCLPLTRSVIMKWSDHTQHTPWLSDVSTSTDGIAERLEQHEHTFGRCVSVVTFRL